MTLQLVPASSDQMVLTFVYDPTGLAWVECSDHRVIGWLGDDGVGPGPSAPATPVIPAGLPPEPPATGAIISPRWAQVFGDGFGVVAPDQFRGHFHDFLTWLGTNNGAAREVRGNFLHASTVQSWELWLGDK